MGVRDFSQQFFFEGEKWDSPPEIFAYVIHAVTGEVLVDQGGDVKMVPAFCMKGGN